MAATRKPTNDHIVELLERILDELAELKQAQDRLASQMSPRS